MVWGRGPNSFFVCRYSVVSESFVEKGIFSHSQWIAFILLMKISLPEVLGFISRLLNLLYWSICISLCQYHTVIYYSFVVTLEIENGEFSNLLFFFNTILAIMDSLHFHINFRVNLSISTKGAAEIFRLHWN